MVALQNQEREYLLGRMDRAEHHAPEVVQVVPALFGYVRTYASEGSLRAMSRNGELMNLMKFQHRSGGWYGFRYDHRKRVIELRSEHTQGPIVHEFSNRTTLPEMHRVFELL